ncbi:MAG: polyprenyl diphosphate synthase [Waddliaceae bacterium]
MTGILAPIFHAKNDSRSETPHTSGNQLPTHIAIIPDGNRRWAKKNLRKSFFGHKTGSNKIIETVLNISTFGISFVTFYLFSTENWARPKNEIDQLMDLLLEFLIVKREEMIENGIRLETIGDLSQFSEEIQREIKKTKDATKDLDNVCMILALNYGSRNEICRAFNRMIEEGVTELDEKKLSSFLDTAKWPDPDLLIRTSGENRLSNFLLWQLSYAELYITTTLWPDFSKQDLSLAIDWFQKRNRRLGG